VSNSGQGFFAGCKTTAMAIMPHTDVKKGLKLAMGLDIPFWPQLPNVSFGEDMYAQTAHNFPGISIDYADGKVNFSKSRFLAGLNEYSEKMIEPDTFTLKRSDSVVYNEFLNRELGDYVAVRGQVTGPVSFGFRVVDEDSMPVIYQEDIRNLLFDFIQRKVNAQYRQLREKNANAFVWLDEPGLGWVFSGLSGYNDVQAKNDYEDFISAIEGPKALHLCANVNLPYLLDLGIDILSFDAFQIETMPKGYASDVARFVENGGIISWGIVPTDRNTLDAEMSERLSALLLSYWDTIAMNSEVSTEKLAGSALIAPARCCLKNAGEAGPVRNCRVEGGTGGTSEERIVERALACTNAISSIMKERFSF